jgi:hypothetical protein
LYESGSILKTISGSSDTGLSIDFLNKQYRFGQITGSNRLHLLIDDTSQTFQTNYNGSARGIEFNYNLNRYDLGTGGARIRCEPNTITTISPFSSGNGISLNFSSDTYRFGMLGGVNNNSIAFFPNQVYTEYGSGNPRGLRFTYSTRFYEFGQVTGSNLTRLIIDDINQSIIASGSFTVITGSNIEFQVTNTGVRLGNTPADIHTVTGSLNITGSGRFTNGLTVTSSLYVTGAASSVGSGHVLTYNTSSGLITYATASGVGGGSSLKTKSGRIVSSSFNGLPLSASVVFVTPFATNDYSITVTGEDARIWTISNKTTSSFTANSNSNTLLNGTTYWVATEYGEN